MKISERVINENGEFVDFPRHLREKAQREGHYDKEMDVDRPCEKARDTLHKPRSKRLKDELNKEAVRKQKKADRAKKDPASLKKVVSLLSKGTDRS